jgi:hypothetical protein
LVAGKSSPQATIYEKKNKNICIHTACIRYHDHIWSGLLQPEGRLEFTSLLHTSNFSAPASTNLLNTIDIMPRFEELKQFAAGY